MKLKFAITKTKIILAIFLVLLAAVYWNSRQHLLTYDDYRDMHLGKNLLGGQYSFFGDAYFKHPPLYMMILATSFAIFGFGEDAGYVVSILFALATLVVTFLFAKRVTNTKIAFAAIAILAVNPWFVQFARDLRFEMATTFFFLLSLYTYWRFLEASNKKYLIASGVSIGLGLLTKSFIFLLFPAYLLFVILLAYKKKYNFIKGFLQLMVMTVVAFLVYSPWIIYTSLNHGPSQLTAQIEEFTGKLSWAPDYVPPPLYFYIFQLPDIITYPVLMLSLIGIVYFFKHKSRSLLLILSWIFVYFIFVSIMGWKEGRFLVYLIPGFAILAASGLNWILQKIKVNLQKIFWPIVGLAVLPGIIFSFSPLWPYAKSPIDWELWDYVDKVVDKNDYLLTNNYGMVEIYSRSSDFLIKNWEIDSFRFLTFDTEYALIEPEVDYPKNFPEIFTAVKQFNLETYENNISLILYKIDLEKLSKMIYGENSIAITGNIYDVNTGQGIHRSKLITADPTSGQSIGLFYSKLDGTIVAYLPRYGTYLMQASAFGYESETILVDVKSDVITICKSQTECLQKPNLGIGLVYKSFLVHEYPNIRF